MTSEQLDAIEKLARDPKSAAFHDLMARQTIPLVKALREARAEAKRELIAYVTAERDKLLGQNQNQLDWFQHRFNVLRKWVKDEVEPLSEQVAHRYWNIVANGSPSPLESADWQDTLHYARVQAEVEDKPGHFYKRNAAYVDQDGHYWCEKHLPKKTKIAERMCTDPNEQGVCVIHDYPCPKPWAPY